MPLYTNFQDPAQYYQRKEEGREESMRQAMAMMMQAKMQEREWRRQARQDELSERRVAAYEKSVTDQDAVEQKQWQAKWAVFDKIFPPGSVENMALKAGIPLETLESGNYPASIVSDLQGAFKMSPGEWEGLTSTNKRMLFQNYMQNERVGEARALTGLDKAKKYDIDLVEAAINHVRDQRSQYEKRYKNIILGEKNAWPEIDKNFASILDTLSGLQRRAINPDFPPLSDEEKRFIEQKADVRKSSDNPYYYIPESLVEEFRKRFDLQGRNNLAVPFGDMRASIPTPEEAGVNPELPGGRILAKAINDIRSEQLETVDVNAVLSDQNMEAYVDPKTSRPFAKDKKTGKIYAIVASASGVINR